VRAGAGGRQDEWESLQATVAGLLAAAVQQAGGLAEERRPGNAQAGALREACDRAMAAGLAQLQQGAPAGQPCCGGQGK
jgi:hypothetical protein